MEKAQAIFNNVVDLMKTYKESNEILRETVKKLHETVDVLEEHKNDLLELDRLKEKLISQQEEEITLLKRQNEKLKQKKGWWKKIF